MTCISPVPGVMVCGPDNRFLRKRYVRCPMCECTTEMVARYEAWHGVTLWCLRCGDSWCDGELYPRPFRPRWRRDSIARARRLWDVATHGPSPTFEELFPESASVEDVAVAGEAS